MPVKTFEKMYHGEHGVEIRWYDELLEHAVNQGYRDVRDMLFRKHCVNGVTLVDIAKELKRCPEGVGDLLRKFDLPITKMGGRKPNPALVYESDPCPKCGGTLRYKRNNVCRKCESIRGAAYRQRRNNGRGND